MARSIDHPPPAPPAAIGELDGLAYTLWLPEGPPRGSVVVVHGADSRKENHQPFARALRDAGVAAVVYDQRGHGASRGALDDRVLDDVRTMATLLPPGPIGLRGTSMGGYVVLRVARRMGAAAVVAICPAPAALLAHGLAHDEFNFAVDRPAVLELLAHDDLEAEVAGLDAPLLLMHARGDERVPVAGTEALAALAPAARLIVTPGGHHRSIQQDAELQGEAVRFLTRALRRAARTTGR